MKKVNKNIVLEDARIGFRNFSGSETQFNPKGRRNFVAFLETELANILEEDGWNIKWLDPREEGEEPQPFLPVAVSYANIPPKIVLISGQGKTLLDENTVNLLDWAEIDMVDLIVRPYNWEVNGKTGVKGYVKSMYVTIIEDEFAHKYSDIPQKGAPQIDIEEEFED